ncbi:MAG: hypothetical protein CO186_07395, partial [Zetaproteobacteria bacterium CG_4_9_14_3_um_filter_49_83]
MNKCSDDIFVEFTGLDKVTRITACAKLSIQYRVVVLWEADMQRLSLITVMIIGIFTIFPISEVYAASGVGRAVYVSGEAWVERGSVKEVVERGQVVLRNDFIVTGANGRVKLVMS